MSVCQRLLKPNKSLFLLQLQKLISFQYRNKFSGEDRFFRSIDQLVGDSEFVCDVEQLAQVLAKKGNKVFRYGYLLARLGQATAPELHDFDGKLPTRQ